MGITIDGIRAYNPASGLLSSTAANTFTGVNAIASLVSNRKTLQSGNYKRLLKEYYALENSHEKPTKKTVIKEEVKTADRKASRAAEIKKENSIEEKKKSMSIEEAKKTWEDIKKQSYDETGNYNKINYQQIDSLFAAMA